MGRKAEFLTRALLVAALMVLATATQAFMMGGSALVLACPSGSPTYANQFRDTTQSLSFNALDTMMRNNTTLAGDHLEVLNSGVPIYLAFGPFQESNLILTLDSGVAIGCGLSQGASVLTVDTGVNPIASTVLNCEGATVAFGTAGDGTGRGLNIGHGDGFTVNGGAAGCLFRDNDFGIQSGNGTGTRPGITLTNVHFDHNGSALNSAATHNYYGGTDQASVTISGGYSRCASDRGSGLRGFEVKSRHPTTTISNFTAAEPSLLGFTDCDESAAIDVSCGGVATLGGAGVGQGLVIEVGAGLDAGSFDGIVRYGHEATNTTNCPAGGTGWATNTVLVQNSWLINDSVLNVVMLSVLNITPSSAQIKNSKIVCNGSQTCDAAHVLGSGVTDGGGNTFFTNRAAAGLAAYPALPAVM